MTVHHFAGRGDFHAFGGSSMGSNLRHWLAPPLDLRCRDLFGAALAGSLARADSKTSAGLLGVARGAKIMNMFFPSSRGSRSTVASGAMSSAMRSSSRRPNDVYVISRPRNMIVTLILLPSSKQPLGHPRFRLVVVRLDLRPQLHFLEFEVALLLAGILIFLRLLVFQPPVVGDLTDRRLGVGRDLDEVQAGAPRTRERVFGWQDPELVRRFRRSPEPNECGSDR